MNAPHRAVLLLATLAACATEGQELVQKAPFDTSAGEVEITVDGDGFVHAAGRRMPLEAIVLELRQRTRAMTKEDREKRFVVHVLMAAQPARSEAAVRAAQSRNRLVDELYVMGVKQIMYL